MPACACTDAIFNKTYGRSTPVHFGRLFRRVPPPHRAAPCIPGVRSAYRCSFTSLVVFVLFSRSGVRCAPGRRFNTEFGSSRSRPRSFSHGFRRKLSASVSRRRLAFRVRLSVGVFPTRPETRVFMNSDIISPPPSHVLLSYKCFFRRLVPNKKYELKTKRQFTRKVTF